MEDTICLCRVQMPDELTIDQWGSWGHHPVDPFRIEPSYCQKCESLLASTRYLQALVDVWTLIRPLSLHVEVVTALQRNGPACTDFVRSGGNGQTNLPQVSF